MCYLLCFDLLEHVFLDIHGYNLYLNVMENFLKNKF